MEKILNNKEKAIMREFVYLSKRHSNHMTVLLRMGMYLASLRMTHTITVEECDQWVEFLAEWTKNEPF